MKRLVDSLADIASIHPVKTALHHSRPFSTRKEVYCLSKRRRVVIMRTNHRGWTQNNLLQSLLGCLLYFKLIHHCFGPVIRGKLFI